MAASSYGVTTSLSSLPLSLEERASTVLSLKNGRDLSPQRSGAGEADGSAHETFVNPPMSGQWLAIHWTAWNAGLASADVSREGTTPFSPPSGPAQRLFQGPPAESKFLAVEPPPAVTAKHLFRSPFPPQPPFPRPPDRPNGCFRGRPPKANY